MNENIKKGKLLAEGKTKEIYELIENGLVVKEKVIIKQKTKITKHDDPTQTREFATKARYANVTTCRVFEVLKIADVPVAFIKQISSTEFLAFRCDMLSLEVVARRYAYGSYVKRNPSLKRPKGEHYRFHDLVIEFFLKTTRGQFNSAGVVIVDGLDPKKEEEDPLVLNPYDDIWNLYHSKKPFWNEKAKLREGIRASDVVGLDSSKIIQKMTDYIKDIFLILEGFWASVGCRFIDMKVEFGIGPNGELFVADVIDNDSWRLKDKEWEELSKEAFRQNEALSDVERKYGIVTSLVEKFRIPNQALIFWRGSDKDKFPVLDSRVDKIVNVEKITLSGHKSPQACINKLEEIMRKYPEGGVIIVKVGLSNGLAPTLAARTTWPIITIPATVNKFSNDVWSSLRMPSRVPLATILSESNAIMFAKNILAQKNPLLYWLLRKEVETLDISSVYFDKI